MRWLFVCAGLSLGLLSVTGCGTGGGITGSSYNPGYGPFDRRGNYVEAWADKPARQHAWAQQPGTSPTPAPTATQPPRIASVTPPSRPPALPQPRPTPRPTPTVARVEQPRPTYTPPPRPKPPAPKPKPPAARKHTVASGDTLYSLSRRYGTSVSAIQRANGLSGTTIVVGKTLSIPR